MSEPRLRRATPADLSAVLALINDPDSPHRQEACRHREEPEAPGMLYDRLSDDENYVIEEDGEIVAYASWQVFGTHAHLNVLSVAGKHQRRGFGKRLFEAFRVHIRRAGQDSFSLRAYADSPWAIAFYARLGLKPLTPLEELAPDHPGLLHYMALSIAHGQWPVEGKVLFFEAL